MWYFLCSGFSEIALENLEKVEAYLADQERLWDEVRAKETVLPEALSARLTSPNRSDV